MAKPKSRPSAEEAPAPRGSEELPAAQSDTADAQAQADATGGASIAPPATSGGLGSHREFLDVSPVAPATSLGGKPAGEFLDASPTYIERVDALLKAEEAEIRARFPAWAAAIDAWQAKGNELPPTGVRIISRREGFRRAGLAHSCEPTVHPIETFATLELLEALFSERNLAAELV